MATEHGGIAYNDPIFVYVLSDDARQATLVETVEALPNTVCKMATTLIEK